MLWLSRLLRTWTRRSGSTTRPSMSMPPQSRYRQMADHFKHGFHDILVEIRREGPAHREPAPIGTKACTRPGRAVPVTDQPRRGYHGELIGRIADRQEMSTILPAALGGGSYGWNRYPMPGSVSRCRGRAGSDSSLLRSWAMYWRTYCVSA